MSLLLGIEASRLNGHGPSALIAGRGSRFSVTSRPWRQTCTCRSSSSSPQFVIQDSRRVFCVSVPALLSQSITSWSSLSNSNYGEGSSVSKSHAGEAQAAGLFGFSGSDGRSKLRTGSAKFQQLDAEGALSDFDVAYEEAPELRPYMWQRGLSLYYADR